MSNYLIIGIPIGPSPVQSEQFVINSTDNHVGDTIDLTLTEDQIAEYSDRGALIAQS